MYDGFRVVYAIASLAARIQSKPGMRRSVISVIRFDVTASGRNRPIGIPPPIRTLEQTLPLGEKRTLRASVHRRSMQRLSCLATYFKQECCRCLCHAAGDLPCVKKLSMHSLEVRYHRVASFVGLNFEVVEFIEAMKQPVPSLQRGPESVSQCIVKLYAFFQAAKQVAKRAPVDVVK